MLCGWSTGWMSWTWTNWLAAGRRWMNTEQPGLFALMRATVRRELLIALRSPGDFINPLVFFVISVTLFPLGVGADTVILGEVAAGVVWVTALLAVMLSLDSMFRADYEDGSLEQLLLSP